MRDRGVVMRERILLFLKGMCMGIADVIPGVSGGTLALVLGVYKEFVDTLRGLHPRVLLTGWRWLSGGRKPEDLAQLQQELHDLNLLFLITLVGGIFTAVLVGSTFIPYLIENHPTPTRAFFFGLILASVYVPAKMIKIASKSSAMLGVAALLAVAGAAFGFFITNPANGFSGAKDNVVITSKGETIKQIARRGPTSATLEQIYWAENNAALRDAIAEQDPKVASDIAALREAAGKEQLDKKALKARSVPYEEIEVPAGVEVNLPRPALWFIGIAGAIAICAMILPGISGSYILLIFGVYFFILNALKGMLSLLAAGTFPANHILYLGVFGVAIVVGILSFARVLSFLLERYAAPTLGVLVGLMIGCLRGIWPFQQVVDGALTNVLPTGDMGVAGAATAAIVGFVLVVALSLVGSRFEEPPEVEA